MRQPGLFRAQLRRRGNRGAAQASAGVAWERLLANDQGGGFSPGVTRVHWAGLAHTSGAAGITTVSTNNLQGVGAGQMLYAIPQFFPVAGTITRIVTRTNGTLGAAGTGRLKMGVYADGELASGSFSGTPFPGAKEAEGDDHALTGANMTLHTAISVSVEAGSYHWFGLTVNNQAVTEQWTIVGMARNNLYPILGYTIDALTPTTIGQDSLTFGVGWRHAITYTLSDDLPDPFPTSAPAALTAGAAVGTVNLPGIGYTFVRA